MQAAAQLATPWSSLIHSAAADEIEERELLRTLLLRYWKPIYSEIHWGWGETPVAAKELTRQFVWHELEDRLHAAGESAKSGFRELIQSRLRSFRTSSKNGSGPSSAVLERTLPLSLLQAADSLALAPEKANSVFDWHWLTLLLRRALREMERDLEAAGDLLTLRLFVICDLQGDHREPAALAREIGIPESQLEMRLEVARRRLRHLVSLQIDEYATDLEDARRELRWVLG